MEIIRKIKRIVSGRNAVDGAGVKLVRVFGHDDTKDFDPFLMLDAFDSKNYEDYIKGFPFHPHRGIETITYLINGEIEHQDSLKNKGSILDGECQWMTAGSGIIHQEMPKISERLLGLQIWLNLPSKDKMTKPEYRGITKKDIPVIKEDGATIRIISGEYKGQKGPVFGDYVNVNYFDIEIEANTQFEIETNNEETVFVYIISGSSKFGGEDLEINSKNAVLFEYGYKIQVNTNKEGVRFVLLSGKPLNEPIAWGGPIVMNTREELNNAFDELQMGTFIKEI